MKDRLSRRSALRAGAGLLAGFGAVGQASATEVDTPVRVNVGYGAESGRAAVERAATALVWEFSFDAVTALVPEGAIEGLAARSDVAYVERDTTVEAIERGPLGLTGQTVPSGIDRIDAPRAHRDGATGAGADVAIVDTGIDRSHTDLLANVGASVTTIGQGTADVGGVAAPGGQDDNGHGTHCAGIAAAADNDNGVVGVAPAATLHGVKALAASGLGLASDVAKGVDYAAGQGWNVVSMSLSGSSSQTLEAACAAAADSGVFLVAAAGNNGGAVQFPAAYDSVVAVSAVDPRSDSFAAFSARGSEIEVAGPGVGTYSTYLRGYATLDGTSMAAPHVAGVAALLMGQGDSAGQARTTIRRSAESLSGVGSDEEGAGLVDAAAAVNAGSNDDGSGGPEGYAGAGYGLDAGV